jgi:sigma-54 dependent transcriptional regulator, acetoin dehydrogenase operon transcriptional activator AcoR
MLSSAPSSPAHRHALIAQARQTLLVDGEAPLRAEVEPWIARSWQRCLAQGMDPTQRVVFEAVSAPALRRSLEQNQALLRAARPVLEQLTRAIAGMRYFAILTDARGTVVEVQGHCDPRDPRASSIGRVGIDLSEAAVGTTAIGAALAEMQPVWLHRGEHFLDDNGSYSCAGAPLFDPEGRCIGMLDLTGIDVPERPELRHLVARSARAMEDALLLQLPHALLLRVNWPGCPLGGEGDGLLTLDTDGCVVGANSMARQLVPQPLRAPACPAPAPTAATCWPCPGPCCSTRPASSAGSRWICRCGRACGCTPWRSCPHTAAPWATPTRRPCQALHRRPPRCARPRWR